MPDVDVATSLAQLGVAGLVGWMWLTERRASAARERQLDEAHEKLMQERQVVDALLAALRENTRVLGSIEAGQRTLLTLLEGWKPRQAGEGGQKRPAA
ncbi:MAG: hypothetical protein GC200_08385 [Tepidisphaera sp.]|nr:hypothetical protein [Tepidisphaera sp.]